MKKTAQPDQETRGKGPSTHKPLHKHVINDLTTSPMALIPNEPESLSDIVRTGSLKHIVLEEIQTTTVNNGN